MTVYGSERDIGLVDMSRIRWFKISEALASLGYEVDIATGEFKWRLRQPVVPMGPRLRRVPLSSVDWHRYDVVKTLFHRGFRTLGRYGGTGHPFILSKLGSVVGSFELDGVPFHGRHRRQLYRLQERMATTSRFITVLTEGAQALWAECHGTPEKLLLVPGAADRIVPPRQRDPYPDDGRIRCLFAGNFYSTKPGDQPESHRVLVHRLNTLGELLGARGARLYLLGTGDPRRLDPRHVTYLGSVQYEASWDYLYFAQVGIVLSGDRFLQNNERTKVYHYLRAGLPVVSETGYPNDYVVSESGLGVLVENGALDAMAETIVRVARAAWDRDAAVRYILELHTWDQRAKVYDRLFRTHLAG